MVIEDHFNWDDFMGDTIEASSAATGAWLRCLYKMRRSVTRGRLSWPLSNYARLFGTSQDQARTLIDEISTLGIGEAETLSDGTITLTNRRLFREGMSVTTAESYDTEPQQTKEDMGTVKDTTPHIYSSSSLKDTQDKEKKERNKNVKRSVEVERIFAYWQTRLNHPKAILTTERQKLIRARLNDGYSIESLERAIEGCANSPYHMGQNDQRKMYDRISLIFRSGDDVERFIGYNRTIEPRQVSQVGKSDYVEESVNCPTCFDTGEKQVFPNQDSIEGAHNVPCPDCVGKLEKAA